MKKKYFKILKNLKQKVLIGTDSGAIQVQTSDSNYGLIGNTANAHGCAATNQCWVTYITQQLSSDNGAYVVTSGNDGLIKIWSLDKDGALSLVRTLTGHTGWVFQTIELTGVSDRLASILEHYAFGK